MPGSIGILNVGAGDTKLVFDTANPDETAKSAAIVKDMIRRGFVLLIEVGRDEKGPTYRRAYDFDEATAEYIIAGPPPPEMADPVVTAPTIKTPEIFSEATQPAPRRNKGRKAASETRVKAASTNAVGVARTAGG
jgi:hypothetical protein